jgi:hypothetical protein
MNGDFPTTQIMTQASGKTLKQMNPKVALEHWYLWFTQALEALHWLHTNAHSLGYVDPTTLRIDEVTLTLKLYVRPHTQTQSSMLPFNPQHTLYPPEILLKQAQEEGLAFTTAYDLLETKNPSLELCETQLDLDYSARTLQFVWKHLEIMDPYKADVWMLGLQFLKQYLEFLTWPGVLTTPFYRQDHDRFLECLARMLEAHPAKRFSAEALLHTWSPPSLHAEYEEPDAEAMMPPAEESFVPSNSVLEASEVQPSVTDANVVIPQSATPSVPPKPRRLVLSGYHDPAVRNKTRRNLRNSDRTPATCNHVTHTQG